MFAEVANIEKFCLKLSTDLMPDIASILIDTSVQIRNVNISILQHDTNLLFEHMKSQISHSLDKSPFVTDANYVLSLKNKIGRIDLADIGQFSPWQYDDSNYERISLTDDDFIFNYISLVKNRKQMLSSFGGTTVSPKIL